MESLESRRSKYIILLIYHKLRSIKCIIPFREGYSESFFFRHLDEAEAKFRIFDSVCVDCFFPFHYCPSFTSKKKNHESSSLNACF